MRVDRRVAVAVLSAVAVASAGLGWVAGQQIRSPAEVAADAAPPEPSLITVPVELRTLASNVVVRGDVTPDESFEVRASGSSEGGAIVTRLPKAAGDALAEGDVAVEVAGRPVFVLQGALPVFRSFTPSMEGPDVLQLEEALARIGLDPGPVDGTYTTRTGAAVEDLYRRAGYPATSPGADEITALDAAREAVLAAEQELAAARRDLTEASAGLPESERLQLEAAAATARGAADDARRALDAAVAAAAEATAAARAALEAAASDEDRARAQRQLDAALAAEAATRHDGERSIGEAELTVRIEEARYREATTGRDVRGPRDAVEAAANRADQARQALGRLEAASGPSFPAAELVFLPTLPRQVDRVQAIVGQVPEGPVMTVVGDSVQVRAAVTAVDRRLIRVGATARLHDDGLDVDAEATVTSIADEPGTGGAAADRFRVVLQPVDVLPDEVAGLNLRVTIPVESTGGEVLAVPLAALSAAADGTARVQVERDPGTTELVAVTAGLAAGGYVEVTATDGQLGAGDRVVVGLDRPRRSDNPSANAVDRP